MGVPLAQGAGPPFPCCEVAGKGWLAAASAGAGCLPWHWELSFPGCAIALPRTAAEIVQAAPAMSGNEELPDWFGASPSLPSLAGMSSCHMTK